ncbi:MAG: hypothetical protein ACRD16_04880 [Thermoanaerobaculia bacterium]
MNRFFASGAALLVAPLLFAHVTPNIQLVKRGDFIQSSLPGASKFSEKVLMIGGPDMAAIKAATGWTPSEEDAKIYLGRDSGGRLVGSVAFIWMPSEHGPVGVGVAFDLEGKILRVNVTDVGTEPLAWVRPLTEANGLSRLVGLTLGQRPDSAAIGRSVHGNMSRYYAGVIAEGVARAQALERVSLTTSPS